MVLYFTGTGNSHAAAMQLQYRLGGKLINITNCVWNSVFAFDVADDEPVGIVCPVYYGGLPSIVNEFIEKLTFNKEPCYIYGVLTMGGRVFGAKEVFVQRMKNAGHRVSAVWDIKMPANFAILYEPTNEEKAEIILDEADDRLCEIISLIEKRAENKNEDASLLAESEEKYKIYEESRKTADFYTIDTCVSCGICAGRCPVKAIELIDGTPTWIKDTCVFCMSCVRCNAIQYGDKMVGRYRYRHPIYRKKKKKEESNSCH